MIDKTRFIQESARLDVAVSDQQAAMLDAYIGKMSETNKSLNLTAITDPREIEIKHLLDCAALCALPELGKEVADVGTGAGFPGVVIKILRPELNLTLIDATAKKLSFVEQACREIGIEVKILHGRAEEIARRENRETYDTVVSRAVAQLCSLAEYCLPLVKVGGCFVAMKGPEAAQETAESLYAIKEMGGSEPLVENFSLPGGIERILVKIKKISQTPSKYPRNSKNIAKNPL